MREKKNGKNSYKSALLSHHWMSFRQSFISLQTLWWCHEQISLTPHAWPPLWILNLLPQSAFLSLHNFMEGKWQTCFLHWVDVVVSNTSFASDIVQVQCHQSLCLPTHVIERFFRCPRNCTCSVQRWNLIFLTVTMAHLSGLCTWCYTCTSSIKWIDLVLCSSDLTKFYRLFRGRCCLIIQQLNQHTCKKLSAIFSLVFFLVFHNMQCQSIEY